MNQTPFGIYLDLVREWGEAIWTDRTDFLTSFERLVPSRCLAKSPTMALVPGPAVLPLAVPRESVPPEV